MRDLLRQRGHSVTNVTFTGFAERRHLNSKDVNQDVHVADVVNTLFFEDIEDAVLVGHSYSGSVIPGVLKAAPQRIRKAVFFDALVCRTGESVSEAMGFMTREQCEATVAALQRGEASIYSGVAEMQREMAKTEPFLMSAERQQWMLDHLSEMPTRANVSPVAVGAEAVSLPVEYIACTQTIMVSQHARARQLDWPIHVMEGDHAVMVGEPEATVELLERLA
ncbi:esterase [Pseudomonas sp. NBRC 100443]|nr:esterase [Pseudomonas sp. NBRC 100443]